MSWASIKRIPGSAPVALSPVNYYGEVSRGTKRFYLLQVAAYPPKIALDMNLKNSYSLLRILEGFSTNVLGGEMDC